VAQYLLRKSDPSVCPLLPIRLGEEGSHDMKISINLHAVNLKDFFKIHVSTIINATVCIKQGTATPTEAPLTLERAITVT
jgi:hypothetical protein